MYEKQEYAKIEMRLLNALSGSPNNVVYNHVLGKVYATASYENHDFDKAFNYLYNARKYYRNASQSEKDRFARIPLDGTIIKNDFTAVCDTLLQIALKQNTIQSLNNFINNYSKAPKEIRDKAENKRNALAYNLAFRDNTIESYNVFINTYPDAQEVSDARKYRDRIAYDVVIKDGTVEAFKKFMTDYPQSIYYDEINSKYTKMLFEYQTKAGTYNGYATFVKENPKSEMAPVAIERMIEIAKDKKDINLLRKAVYASNGIHYNYAVYEYYKEFTNDGDYITLYQFYNEFKNLPFEQIMPQEFKIAEMGENLEMHRGFDSTRISNYVFYIKLAAPKEKAFVALQRLISLDVNGKRWQSALDKVASLESYFGENDERIENLKAILSAKYDASVNARPLSDNVNTPEGGEYSPVISADNKTLYFCGKNRPENVGGEDIFVTHFENGEWTTPKLVSELSGKNTNDATLSVSTDGTSMLFFRGGTVNYTNKTSTGWGQAYPFSEAVNSAQWSADAMVSSDGNALIFASVRPEGLNYYTNPGYDVGTYHGTYLHQTDIYISLKEGNGWSKPKSLGNVINTKYTDRSPFLHPDMKTLYFSSDGHGGLGNMDVFMSTRLSDTCWDCWSKPVNLGKEINTAEDNWGYRISTDGKYAYYAATKVGIEENDIYVCNLPQAVRPETVVTISGKLLDENGKPISATIKWEDLSTGKYIGQSQSDPSDGSYFIVLPHGKMYGYYIDDNNLFPLANSIDLTKTDASQEITQNIKAVTIDHMKTSGESVRLNNLFFNTAKSDLLPYSIPELKRTARIIKKYNAQVEISGHTDNVGEDAANKDLSLRRATAVRDFLVKQGCSASLFVVVGHGETKPSDTNATVEGRANNRRVELRFVK